LGWFLFPVKKGKRKDGRMTASRGNWVGEEGLFARRGKKEKATSSCLFRKEGEGGGKRKKRTRRRLPLARPLKGKSEGGGGKSKRGGGKKKASTAGLSLLSFFSARGPRKGRKGRKALRGRQKGRGKGNDRFLLLLGYIGRKIQRGEEEAKKQQVNFMPPAGKRLRGKREREGKKRDYLQYRDDNRGGEYFFPDRKEKG